MEEKPLSCVKPSRGPLDAPEPEAQPVTEPSSEEVHMTVRVGKPAPDFEATAFVDGGFKPVKLSDYKGHWVVLCFYPGDFTFV